MGGYGTIYEIYTAEQQKFDDLVDELLQECGEHDTIIRLVFFGKPADNKEYREQLKIIDTKVRERYSERLPVVSYVAQQPLVGELALEVCKISSSSQVSITWSSSGNVRYLEIEDDEHRELVLGGVQGKDLNAGIREQSDQIFKEIGAVLEKKEYDMDAIVRQWNYIERITHFVREHQHYQDFNDSRSHFYAQSSWQYGYPAATGIGSQLGGVLVDLNVVKPKTGAFRIVPLDNEWQVAAHVYSQEVLIGAQDKLFKYKTTPKFERAKAVAGARKGIVYISGTAAIRGEQSLEGVGILVQTGITMENINFLISAANLKKNGLSPANEPKIELLRVYIKNPEEITAVKVYMESVFTGIPVSYLLADVCRDELLVEIEGVASFTLSPKA